MLSFNSVLCRITRENSAGSEMSKLLSFGYLDTNPQSAVDNRKFSAGSRSIQPSSAGHRATRGDLMATEYQANSSLQSSARPGPTHGSDFAASEYQANMLSEQRPAAGVVTSSRTSSTNILPPAHFSAT